MFPVAAILNFKRGLIVGKGSFFRDEDLQGREKDLFLSALLQGHGGGFTMEELAGLTGVSKQRIGQIYLEAMEKIRFRCNTPEMLEYLADRQNRENGMKLQTEKTINHGAE